MLDCTYVFCCGGATTDAPIYSKADVDDGRHCDRRDRRRRGRSRTPRKNVNGSSDSDSTGRTRQRRTRPRRTRGRDGGGNNGPNTMDDSTDRTERTFKSDEIPHSRGFFPLSQTVPGQHDGNESCVALESPTSSSVELQKKPRLFVPSPRSPRTCRERANAMDQIIMEHEHDVHQKEQHEDQETQFRGGKECDLRDDAPPATTIAQNLLRSLGSYSVVDFTASTERARGRRMCTFEHQLCNGDDDKKNTISLSSLLQSLSSASIADSIVSSGQLNEVDMTADDETRSESSTAGTSISGSMQSSGAVSRLSNCRGVHIIEPEDDSHQGLSPKKKKRSKRSKSASKFVWRNIRSLSHVFYGRRISNRNHHGLDC